MSESKGLVSYGGKDIAKERALVCGDRSMSLLVHISLNKERNVNAFCLVLFFPLLVLSGNTTHEMMTYQHQVRNPADPLWKQSHRYTQRCTSLLTYSFLNAPMLIKINHNTQFYNRDMLASKSETLGTA